MFVIETPRLFLRDVQETDVEPFFRLGSDPAILRFQTFIRVDTESQARAWIAGAVFHNQQVPRLSYNLAIQRKLDQAWLGWIGIGQPSNRSLGDLDFGYALHGAYWGKGCMTEALIALLDACFHSPAVEKIFGECERGNIASARVMQKAGLRLETAFEKQEESSGQIIEMQRYAIMKADWPFKTESQPDNQVPKETTP